MKIVPAILAEDPDDFLLRIRQAESLTQYVQIDLMDGIFVSSRSFPEERINDIQTPLAFEIHIMAEDPEDFMSRIHHAGLKKAIFHFESKVDPSQFAERIRKRGLQVGMAINPETEISEFKEAAREIESLHFLTVDPGFYGNPFKPQVLKKIEASRQISPDKIISVDGGISLDNLKIFFDLKVDYACVGSRIFLRGDPKENYRQFIEALAKLEVNPLK